LPGREQGCSNRPATKTRTVARLVGWGHEDGGNERDGTGRSQSSEHRQYAVGTRRELVRGYHVALIYYRRSIRFMLPAACVVSFSRVYNGVHYPSDVLAGAIIGRDMRCECMVNKRDLAMDRPEMVLKAWAKMPSLILNQ